jgi:hypothetical protein
MTSAGTVTVNVEGRDKNLVALLNRLDASMRATDQAGLKLSQTVAGPFTTAQQRAANAAIQEAQALARAAIAAGDDARAHNILVGALGNSAGANDRSVASLTTSINKLQSGAGFAQQFGASMKSSLLGIIGPAALASAAIAGIGTVIRTTEDAFILKANLDATTAAIKAQLVGLRDSNTVFAQGQVFANKYKLTQQELTDALQTSISVMRVSNASTTDILNTFARLVTLAPDKTISDAARAVRELAAGDVTSIKELFNVSAANAHKMKEEIAAGGDAVQVINKFLDQANIGMAGMEAKASGAAGKMKELAQSTERFQLAIAGQSGGLGLEILETRIRVTDDATRTLSGDLTGVNSIIGELGSITGSVLAPIAAYNDAVFNAGRATLEWAGAIPPTTVELEGIAGATAAAAKAIQDAIPPTIGQANATAILAAYQADGRRESILLAQAIQDAAIASGTAGQAAELQALQTQILAAQAQNAANAFLNLNPGIDQAGIRAAANAGLVPQLTAKIAELTLAIRAAKSELGQATGGGGGPGLSASSFLESQRFFNKNQREAANAAAAAQREQTLAVGTTAQKMALLNRELAEAKKRYGEGSAQAIRAQTAIDQAVDRSAKKVKGAGAAKLSDQQKLNNTLLGDQERFQQQVEDAEKEHGKRLLDIEEDYQKKSLAQQKANEVSKRRSRADFYESLTSAAADISPQIAQELSAAYEAAYAQAQAIAQAGNAKLAADYLALKEQQIRDEIEFQKKLAEAQKAKDSGEVARLEAIHKLRQDQQAEEEKQLLAGGDENVKARDEALTDEQRRFEEAQGKIGDSAENAAERKVNAAVRSGKAVDDETAKLREQEAVYNRIGARTPASPGAPVSPAAPTTPAPAGLTGAAGIDLSTLASLLQSVVDALHTEGGRITGAVQDTTGAVRGLGSRLSGA